MVAHAVACCVSPEPQLVGCSPWADLSGLNVYHWEFADPERLDEPIPMRGRQRLWTIDEDVLNVVAPRRNEAGALIHRNGGDDEDSMART